uniref:Uncharacterized protein n=1 Tax=Oryza glaberrima TaxID=4538 RepID=I1NTX1_ORYGL
MREKGERHRACDLRVGPSKRPGRWRRRRHGRRGGRCHTGELEDEDPSRSEVSDLNGIAPAVDDPRKHALVLAVLELHHPAAAHDSRARLLHARARSRFDVASPEEPSLRWGWRWRGGSRAPRR